MDFSEALKAMRMGSEVAREEWRGQIANWHLYPPGDTKIMQSNPDGTFTMKENLRVDDILADDWWILP